MSAGSDSVRRSTSSRTRTNGGDCAARAAPRRGTATVQTDGPGEARLRPHRVRGRRPRRARTRCRRAGPTGRCRARRWTARRSASDRSRTIGRGGRFPYPAGASTATTGTWLLAASRSMRASRRSRPLRGGGGTSLVSRTGKPLASSRTSAVAAPVRGAREPSSSAASDRSLQTARPERLDGAILGQGSLQGREIRHASSGAHPPPGAGPRSPASEGPRRPGHRRNRRFKNPTAWAR